MMIDTRDLKPGDIYTTHITRTVKAVSIAGFGAGGQAIWQVEHDDGTSAQFGPYSSHFVVNREK